MDLIFQSHPDVIIASNVFRNCRTIIKYEQTPILEVGNFEGAGYTTKFPVYHNDGTQIAVVKGAQIYLTEAGKKANLTLRHEANLTVCQFEGKDILELRRDSAAALKGWAELYAPEGVLIRAVDSGASALLKGGDMLSVGNSAGGGIMMSGCTISGFNTGIHVTADGIGIGCNT